MFRLLVYFHFIVLGGCLICLLHACAAQGVGTDNEFNLLRAQNAKLAEDIALFKNETHDSSVSNYDDWTLRMDALSRLIRETLWGVVKVLLIALPGGYISGKLVWKLIGRWVPGAVKMCRRKNSAAK